MGPLAVVIIFLCFVRHGNSFDQSDEEELLKCRVEALEKTVAEMEHRMEYLKAHDKRQSESLSKVVKQASSLGSHCSLLPSGICGRCLCVDDYQLENKYFCDCQHLTAKRDCLEFLNNGYNTSGLYKINGGGIKDMQVFCDQNTDHGGWTVIQRRIDGEINFYRSWKMYKHGFGSVQREFWLGNDNIYVLSLQSAYPKGSELRIDMTDWDEKQTYATYKTFSVGSETNKYVLQVDNYTGNAGDSLVQHKGMKFSTYDQDNDTGEGRSCSRIYRSAWWFERCFSSNLNGEYRWFDEKQPGYGRGVTWVSHAGGYGYSLKNVEMKMRRKT